MSLTVWELALWPTQHCRHTLWEPPIIKMQLLFIILITIITIAATNDYYGEYIGDFQNRFHGVSGEVYAVDSRTIFIKEFR